MKLTIIIATRGRHELAYETVLTMLGNLTEPETRILVCCDEDDGPVTMPIDHRVIVSYRPREDTRGLKYDRALTEAPADLYLVGVDHTPIRTKGFDRLFLDAAKLFPDGIGVVCTPMANASFPFLQAVTAKFAELSGFIQPPHFPFWFIDHWTDDVAKMIGRYAMADVAVDSNARPGITTGLRDLIFWASYFDAIVGQRRAQAERLLKAMDEPEWRKTMLRSVWPMIEYRSRWVNDIVRGENAQMQSARGDQEPRSEGYLRALKTAVEDWEASLPEEKAAA